MAVYNSKMPGYQMKWKMENQSISDLKDVGRERRVLDSSPRVTALWTMSKTHLF